MMNNRPAGYYQMMSSRAFHGHNKGMGSVTTGPNPPTSISIEDIPLTPQWSLETQQGLNPALLSLQGNSSQYDAGAISFATFGDGFGLWFTDPGTAVAMLPSAFSDLTDPPNIGLLSIPLGLTLLVLTSLKKRR